MNLKTILCMLVSVFLLASCGSAPKRRTKKKRRKSTPVQPVVVEEESTPKESKPEKTKAPVKDLAKDTVKDAVKKPEGSARTAFPDEYISGKNLSEWIKDLDNKDSEKVIEACGAIQIANKRGAPAKTKLEALAKSKNKEIAAAAAEALKAIK